MGYDIKTTSWGYDIRSFNRYKGMFELLRDKPYDWAEKHRTWIRDNMIAIQQRWPQFIKEDEIP